MVLSPHLAQLWLNDENRYTNMSLILSIAKSLDIFSLSLAREGSIANDRMYQPTTTLNNKGFWTFDLLQAVLAYNMQIFGLFGLCLLSLYICLSSFYSNDSMHKFHRYILQLWQIGYPKSVVWVNSKFSINQIEPEKALAVPQISIHKYLFQPA